MIRPLHSKDFDHAIAIWFSASIKAHNFIPETYWASQKQNMRDLYLPNCQSWVYKDAGEILGFISYYEGSIPAIFVDPRAQSLGIGTKLLNYLKEQQIELTLTVYAENEKTHRFYLHHRFVDVGKRICEHTNRAQIEMRWTAK